MKLFIKITQYRTAKGKSWSKDKLFSLDISSFNSYEEFD